MFYLFINVEEHYNCVEWRDFTAGNISFLELQLETKACPLILLHVWIISTSAEDFCIKLALDFPKQNIPTRRHVAFPALFSVRFNLMLFY